MQRQLRDAIKNKYRVSNQTSGQVIRALAEVERNRQRASAGIPRRPASQVAQPLGRIERDETIPAPPYTQDVPDISEILGRVGAGGGGIIGLILGLIARLFGLGRRREPESTANTANILNDLTAGATHPSQAPDLASILQELLRDSGAASGPTGPDANIENLVSSLLGGGSRRGMSRPRRR